MTTPHVDLRAGYCRITISESGDLYVPIRYSENGSLINLSTGWTARFQVWRELSDAEAILTLTEGDGITLAATDPNILIDTSPEQSALLVAGGYRYGLRLLNGTTPHPLLYGPLVVESGHVSG